MTAIALHERLPTGRHGIDRSVIVEHQRQRLVEAARAIVLAEGYDVATVSTIIDRAGVSRKTFYELFDDRPECILAAVDGASAMPTGIPALDQAGWRLALSRRAGNVELVADCLALERYGVRLCDMTTAEDRAELIAVAEQLCEEATAVR